MTWVGMRSRWLGDDAVLERDAGELPQPEDLADHEVFAAIAVLDRRYVRLEARGLGEGTLTAVSLRPLIRTTES
jgi:hypothetical protein